MSPKRDLTETPAAEPNRQPVRRGLYYGSAGCCHARLCTVMAFDQASTEARQLCAHLGAGWEPRVWENLGWHYEVSLTSGENTIHVYPVTDGSHTRGGWKVSGYSASFNYQRWHDDKTPEGAVIKVIAAIRAELDALGAVLANATQMTALASPGAAETG